MLDKPKQTLMLRKITTSCGVKRKNTIPHNDERNCMCVCGVKLKHVKIPWGPCISQKGAKVRTTVRLS